MVSRTRKGQRRPFFGMPKEIALLATPDGWRHSVLTVEGGMLCGRLIDVPVDADSHQARAAAAAMVVGLARDFHEAEVDVTWDPPQEPWSWTGRVTPVTGDETVLPDSGGHSAC